MLDKPKPEGYTFGRPTKYRAEMCEQVIEFGKQGKSRAWIAAEFNVCKRTIQVWEAEYPDFAAAMARAKTLEQRWWEDAGQDNMATMGFNASIWNRSMAARFPDDWRETTKQETELTGKNGGPVQFAAMLGKLTQSVLPGDEPDDSSS